MHLQAKKHLAVSNRSVQKPENALRCVITGCALARVFGAGIRSQSSDFVTTDSKVLNPVHTHVRGVGLGRVEDYGRVQDYWE